MPHSAPSLSPVRKSVQGLRRLTSLTGLPLRIQNRAVTLVETMVSLFILALVMLGLLGNFIQSRRISESSVLHAAATALMYGMIEQIKQLDYNTLLPNYEADPSVPLDGNGNPSVLPPYIRLRINQDIIKWVRVVHTTPTDEDASTTTIPYPQGPTTTPTANATAASVGAIDNFLGSIPLSTITGTSSQQINLNLWVWIDDINNKGTWAAEPIDPDDPKPPQPDASAVKKVTIVYTYSYQDGNITRVVRDREVILRTRFDQ